MQPEGYGVGMGDWTGAFWGLTCNNHIIIMINIIIIIITHHHHQFRQHNQYSVPHSIFHVFTHRVARPLEGHNVCLLLR